LRGRYLEGSLFGVAGARSLLIRGKLDARGDLFMAGVGFDVANQIKSYEGLEI